MKRLIVIVGIMGMLVGGTQLPASATDFCNVPVYAGQWRGCMRLNGSKLHVDLVSSRFMGIKDTAFSNLPIKHRLCIDYPTGADACYISGTRIVAGYDDGILVSEYNFNKAGNYPNLTRMCTYIYEIKSGGTLVKRTGPHCATIHS